MQKATTINYPLSFTEEDGDIVVRSREFPELLTAGGSKDEARANAEDALDVVVLAYLEKGRELPEPSKALDNEELIFLPATTAAKLDKIKPKEGFEWSSVAWGAPDQPRAENCSYCAASIDEDEVPLMLFAEDGAAAVFCKQCQTTWWGLRP